VGSKLFADIVELSHCFSGRFKLIFRVSIATEVDTFFHQFILMSLIIKSYKKEYLGSQDFSVGGHVKTRIKWNKI